MPVCSPVRRTFSDERGPGTFNTLGALPKRKVDSTRKSPVFHIAHDDDDDHSSLDEHISHPLSIPTAAVPFPRSSSPPSPSLSPPPQLPRGASSPILLANGKPLKSSLKTSPSSPAVSTPIEAQRLHLRARSEPSTPSATPKNVHFPEEDYGLTTVRVFNRSARPAALSNPANGNGDETETEGEETPPTFFPFPPLSPTFNYEIDPTKSSTVPSSSPPCANLILESLCLLSSSPSPPVNSKPLLTGSVLVRNLAFEKLVAIRFTLDDWQTVSEVGAHYVESLSTLPPHFSRSSSASTISDNSRGRGWDRFNFTIRLEDYAHSLSSRTLWLAARYRVESMYPEPGSCQFGPGGEWWDNNSGLNYRIGFRPALAIPRIRPRRETVSAPVSSSRTYSQHPMICKEHVFGHMAPSIHREPAYKSDQHLVPVHAGKLSLCNYAPPAVRATACTSSTADSSQNSSLPPVTKSQSSPSITRLSSDEETASPASSTLSTPSVSPTMPPRVIIGGQPATSTEEDDTAKYNRPGDIADWDWLVHSKPRNEEPTRRLADSLPSLESSRRNIRSVPSRKALDEDNSLYDAFVTQWCFAQEPSLSTNGYGDSGIMA